MKKIILIFSVLFAFCVMVNTAASKPTVVVDNPVFTFDMIPEGVHVDHEFIIRNTGDTDLAIENVLPP